MYDGPKVRLVERIAHYTKSQSGLTALMNSKEFMDFDVRDALSGNTSISKQIWFSLFNDGLVGVGKYSLMHHNLSDEQILAVANVESVDYKLQMSLFRHSVFEDCSEGTAEWLLSQKFLEMENAYQWLQMGRVPKNVVHRLEMLSFSRENPEPRCLADNYTDAYLWEDVDFQTLNSKISASAEFDCLGLHGRSVLSNPKLCLWVESMLDPYATQGWGMFFEMAQEWKDSVKGLVENIGYIINNG